MSDDLIAWNDDFLVNNKVIDGQHRELVKMTNEFYTGCKKGGVLARVYFLQTIKGAVNYVKTHFVTEEEFMLKANYPEYEAHKKEHEEFAAHVAEQIKIYQSTPNPDPAGFVIILLDWIRNHIATSDKKYAPYIANLKE